MFTLAKHTYFALEPHQKNVVPLQEDFQPMTYGFKLAADVTDVRASGMMKEIEDDLNRTIKVGMVFNFVSACMLCALCGASFLYFGCGFPLQNTRSKPGEQRDADVEKEVCFFGELGSTMRTNDSIQTSSLKTKRANLMQRVDTSRKFHCQKHFTSFSISLPKRCSLGYVSVDFCSQH